MGAVCGGLPGPVPDGVLRLQGEQEGGGEPVNLGDAGQPVSLAQVLRREVAVAVADDVVDHCQQERVSSAHDGHYDYLQT